MADRLHVPLQLDPHPPLVGLLPFVQAVGDSGCLLIDGTLLLLLQLGVPGNASGPSA